MINVLFVTFASKNFDGATYSLMDLIKSVRGEVNPIVMLRTHGCVYDYFTENGVECVVCDFEENLVGIPTKLHQYIKYAIKYIPSHLKYSRKNRKCVEYISQRLKERDIKIVHTNNTVMSVGFEIAKALKAKHVWHLRGFMDLDFGWMPLTGWKNYKKEVAKSDAVIGITPTVLEHFISSSANNAYSVFDAVRSKKDVCCEFPKERYFLFCAGLLSKKKGCDFAIEAFAKSGLASQGYRLRVVGESNEKYNTQLKQILEKYALTESVDFIGRINNVKEQMKHATAFLMCSEHEGLGRVTVEAMFYGCLVIGRNSGGTKDFVFHGKTGFLFNDMDGCVCAMHKATLNDNREIIRYAQEYASSNFSIESYGNKIWSIYEKILDK